MWVTAVGLKCVYPSAHAHLHLCCMSACPCTEESEHIALRSSYMDVCVYSQVAHYFVFGCCWFNEGNGELNSSKDYKLKIISNMITVELTSSEFQLSEGLWEAKFSVSVKAQLVKLLSRLGVKYNNFINVFSIVIFILTHCNCKTSTCSFSWTCVFLIWKIKLDFHGSITVADKWAGQTQPKSQHYLDSCIS